MCVKERENKTYSGLGVQRDSLETDEVVAGGDAGRDGRRPGRVVCDHLAVGPRAGVDGAGEEAGLVNLEPLERARVDARAGGARAFCEVGQLGRENSVFNIDSRDWKYEQGVSPSDQWHAARLGSSRR